MSNPNNPNPNPNNPNIPPPNNPNEPPIEPPQPPNNNLNGNGQEQPEQQPQPQPQPQQQPEQKVENEQKQDNTISVENELKKYYEEFDVVLEDYHGNDLKELIKLETRKLKFLLSLSDKKVKIITLFQIFRIQNIINNYRKMVKYIKKHLFKNKKCLISGWEDYSVDRLLNMAFTASVYVNKCGMDRSVIEFIGMDSLNEMKKTVVPSGGGSTRKAYLRILIETMILKKSTSKLSSTKWGEELKIELNQIYEEIQNEEDIDISSDEDEIDQENNDNNDNVQVGGNNVQQEQVNNNENIELKEDNNIDLERLRNIENEPQGGNNEEEDDNDEGEDDNDEKENNEDNEREDNQENDNQRLKEEIRQEFTDELKQKDDIIQKQKVQIAKLEKEVETKVEYAKKQAIEINKLNNQLNNLNKEFEKFKNEIDTNIDNDISSNLDIELDNIAPQRLERPEKHTLSKSGVSSEVVNRRGIELKSKNIEDNENRNNEKDPTKHYFLTKTTNSVEPQNNINEELVSKEVKKDLIKIRIQSMLEDDPNIKLDTIEYKNIVGGFDFHFSSRMFRQVIEMIRQENN